VHVTIERTQSLLGECRWAGIARPTFDGLRSIFSNSSRVVAKQRVGGFDALYDCALHDGRCRGDTFRTTARLAQILKTREIRGQGLVVLLLSNHGSVGQYIVADATSRIALSGRLGLVVGVFQNARVSRVSQALHLLGQRLPRSARCMHATRSRIWSSLRLSWVSSNSIAIVRRTLFKLELSRREATQGRLWCAV
jgi:hypothetical protein